MFIRLMGGETLGMVTFLCFIALLARGVIALFGG